MARRKRRGVVVVLAAVMLVIMLGMIAFAVDLGVITVARTELQTAADAAALAGVAKLPQGVSTAIGEARYYVQRNSHTSPEINATVGQWDAVSRSFIPGLAPFDAVQVQVLSSNRPLFFGRVMGGNTYAAGASATAIVRPRDIMLVLDFSGSMNEHHKVDQLKEAVALFFDILDDNTNQDRVGFARYSTFGELVMPLSNDYAGLNNEVQKSKANGWTNIGEGMEEARYQLDQNARNNATKMMVIMTDGMANKPERRDPRQFVLDEAQRAHESGIDLYTISFGSDADKTLMDDVAEIGKDVHFSVDGGVSECEEELRKVFVKIATKWKIQLVQ
jgi:uncharacterized protein YegL